MIYITGDTHADFSRFSTKRFPEQKTMTKNDYIIICGDFGGIWDQSTTRTENYWLKWLENKPFTTLFVDGNHENFDRLNNFSISMWHGGKVHKIKESIIHLMRGQIYEIDGKTIFAFGGAKSHDINDGILEIGDPRIQVWNNNYSKQFRVNHISWWDAEMPNDNEMKEAFENLTVHQHKVDFIITHCPPSSILAQMGYHTDRLSNFLQGIHNTTDYYRWFCGHIHINKPFYHERVEIFYESIQRIY